MKQENNSQSNIERLFNIDPLLNELNKVIQNGLNKLLSNYITNYKLYEETHNCIMNLPSVKREFAKKIEVDEIYDDLPDLISISSDECSEEPNIYFKNYCDAGIKNIIYDNLNTPIEIRINDFFIPEPESESDDTILCMKKTLNELLKENEASVALYLEKEKSYKEKWSKKRKNKKFIE